MIGKYFSGRTLVLATMHGKEKSLKSLLEQSLGVHVIVPKQIDTDKFGTFSGEIKREGSSLKAAGDKCNMAYEMTGHSFVMASEGSFGPHPVLGFVPADEELLLLRDYENAFEIAASVTSTSTNFSSCMFDHWDDVVAYANKVGFPSHGLIVRADGGGCRCRDLHKGITDWRELKNSFHYFRSNGTKAVIETDMRAHYNPTRMNVIKEAGEKLVSMVTTVCPICEGPGFVAKDMVRGLPCRQCGWPTKTAKAHRHFCQHCGYEKELQFPDKKQYEDAMYCDMCNP